MNDCDGWACRALIAVQGVDIKLDISERPVGVGRGSSVDRGVVAEVGADGNVGVHRRGRVT
jgi:hypothetical protein